MQTARIASLTLANAMIFQQILSDTNPDVEKLSHTVARKDVARNFAKVWGHILDNINYVPIFTIAQKIALDLQGSPGTDQALKKLADTAEDITKHRAALRHDLMGRIYHWLLADAKYFGAFYTTVPAAALLLKLTLNPDDVPIDWSDLEDIKKLRIADLACGTGTLLKATLQTVVDNYVRACAENGVTPDLMALHQVMVEECLYGLDVVEFSIHLAASALAIHEPEVQFHEMKLWTLPLGSTGAASTKLGSIELFGSQQATVQADLFGSVTGSERITGKGGALEKVHIPPLDLCVMNPPFVRSVGGNLLFGNLPATQRSRMQTALKNLVRRGNIYANVTAGLGSVFAALGHTFVKPGGHTSLVLPRALLSGVAWKKTRALIGDKYQIQYVIVSNQPGGWNFSENTNLSECMIVARRLTKAQGETLQSTKFVNLWRKPASSVEAMTLARAIVEAPGVPLENHTGTDNIRIGDHKVGEVIIAPASRMSTGIWHHEAAFKQTDLCRAAFYLTKSEIYIPGLGHIGKVPTTTLLKLGAVGPDRRDIHDGFEEDSTSTAYRAFWGHDTSTTQSMEQTPNTGLSPLPTAQKGRNLRDPQLLWSRAGKVLIAERLRLNTTRVVSIRLSENVLSNTWWTLRLFGNSGVSEENVERIVTLWLNSTLGILSLIAARVDTEGAWIEMKKPILKSIVVLDPFALKSTQMRRLVKAYDTYAKQRFDRIPQIAEDVTRQKIDEAVIEALGISEDLGVLRRMLAEEPLVTGARS
jgi:N-6 DNA Methylase